MADSGPNKLDQLRRENARLIALLEAHGVSWRSSGPAPSPQPLASNEITGSGRSGYTPACANEWRPGICEKPRLACRDCSHRQLLPLSDAAIYGHLAGDALHLATPWQAPPPASKISGPLPASPNLTLAYASAGLRPRAVAACCMRPSKLASWVQRL
jgi:hypothetical protein